MVYVIHEDDIEKLSLSVRSTNCLRRADIHTIGALIDFPADELSVLCAQNRNLT